MAAGGARNRSGPKPDLTSERSDLRGIKLDALPSGGFDGDAPEFPMPEATDRELEVWDELWTTPQACAWALEQWRWRIVAMYCRWSVRSEGVVPAAFLGQVHRLGDQLGLTPAGLIENGWAIARSELDAKREEKPSLSVVDDEGESARPKRRLRG